MLESIAGVADEAAAPGLIARISRVRPRSERALISGALAGREADMAALFKAYWPRAYRSAFLIVHDHAAAEDIAQEAFVQAIRHLHRFDRTRRFGPWLGTIVANRAIDWARARTARREAGWVDRDVPDPGRPPLPGRYSDEVVQALGSLTPEHRAVVVLRYVLEFTPGEIAAALELPRGTVNSRLRRALDVLGARLSEAIEP